MSDLKEILSEFLEGDVMILESITSLTTSTVLKDLSWMLDSLNSFDPRVSYQQGKMTMKQLSSTGELLSPLPEIAENQPDDLDEHTPQLITLGQWWTHVALCSESRLNGLVDGLRHLFIALETLSKQGKGAPSQMLTLCFSLFPLNDETLAERCAEFVRDQFSRNPKLAVHYGQNIVEALEYGTDANLGGTKLLGFLKETARNAPRIVLTRVDTVIQFAIKQDPYAIEIVEKAAKHSPRALYAFVDYVVQCLNRAYRPTIHILSMIASRNALVLRPFVSEIIKVTEDKPADYIEACRIGYETLGILGRVDPESAATISAKLVEWCESEQHSQTQALVAELINIAGVYKSAIQPYEQSVEELCNSADFEVSTKSYELLEILRSSETFIPDYLLKNQEDIWGHPYELVSGSNERKKDVLGANTTIETLTYHADHLAEDESEEKETHQLSAENFEGVQNPQNVLEVALQEELNQNASTYKTPKAESIRNKAKHYQERSKEFIEDTSDRFPLPVAIYSAGNICKRLLLVFRCAYGTKPDVIVKTVNWAKWLRTAAAALNQRKTVEIESSEDPYTGLISLFEAVSRKSIDPQLTLKNLCAQPYLNKGETYELIDDLDRSGVFKDLQYDTTSWTWYRKRGALPNLSEFESGKSQEDEPKGSTARKGGEGTVTASGSQPALKPKPPSQNRASFFRKQQASASPSRNNSAEESLPWQSSPLHWDDLDREEARTTTIHGWMEKYSSGRRTFGLKKKSTRYFEIDANKLSYYEDESKAEKKGTISLHSVESIHVSDDNWVTLCTPNVHGEEYCIRPLNPEHVKIIQERVKQGPVKRRRSQKLPDITQAISSDTK